MGAPVGDNVVLDQTGGNIPLEKEVGDCYPIANRLGGPSSLLLSVFCQEGLWRPIPSVAL